MSHRRDFLRALASGTGAILIGKGWYKQSNIWHVEWLPHTYVHFDLSFTITKHMINDDMYLDYMSPELVAKLIREPYDKRILDQSSFRPEHRLLP